MLASVFLLQATDDKLLKRQRAAVLVLVLVTPFAGLTVTQPQRGRSRIWRVMLSVRRIHRLISAGRHKDFHRVMLITERATIHAFSDIGVRNNLAARNGLTKIWMIVFPAINRPLINTKDAS